MSSKPHINFTTFEEEKTKIGRLEWSFPKSREFFQSNKAKELCTDIYQNSEEVSIPECMLKLKFLGRNNDLIEIYYLFPNSVFIEATLKHYREPDLAFKRSEDKQDVIVIYKYNKIEANRWQYLFKCSMSELLKTYLSDKCFALIFEYEIRTDFNIEIAPETTHGSELKTLLDNGLFSDVIIKSVDGNEYKAHKAILASQSDVLKANFVHNTLECQNNIIESPFESSILHDLLIFIYADNVPEIDKNPEKLLAAADFYQLARLKKICAETLNKKLTVDNVIETLELAELHSEKLLTHLALEFIKDDNAKRVIETEGWRKAKSVEIFKSICESIINNEED